MAESVRNALAQSVAALKSMPLEALLAQRRRRLASYGVYKEN
jgi:acetyl-CoA carboxylase alpha subunit